MTARLDPAMARAVSAAPAPVVLLGGWGVHAAVLQPLADALGAVSVLDVPVPAGLDAAQRRARMHAWLAEQLPVSAVLVGWSLGGTLAADFAAAHPARVAALVTLASNPCFCARQDWTTGMPEAEFAAFRHGVQADAAAQLGRFAALQAQGDANARQVLRMLRGHVAAPADPVALAAGLDALECLDARAALPRLGIPVLHVLGAEDRLVPVALAAALRDLQPGASVWVAAGAGHAPFLSRPEATAARIRDFLEARRPPVAPRARAAVASAFSRAALHYDAAAQVQALGARTLLDCAAPELQPVDALDLGCGTGARLAALAERFPQARWVGADIAEGMLGLARGHAPHLLPVGADAEALPFAAGSFDLVYSNLALQWTDSPERALAEIARVLRPGGSALLSLPGPDTLWELRAAWRMLDEAVHVHRFDDAARLERAARAGGLRVECSRALCHVERHASAVDVARGLRRIGAHNQDPARPRGLTGRRRWQQLAEAYALLGDGDPAGLPATWQILQLRLGKPHG